MMMDTQSSMIDQAPIQLGPAMVRCGVDKMKRTMAKTVMTRLRLKTPIRADFCFNGI